MLEPDYTDSLRADILPSYTDSIMHHGIKGMHWGVRRFQNSDGSLTNAGKQRYGGVNPVRAIMKQSLDSEKIRFENEKAQYEPSNEVQKVALEFKQRSDNLMSRYEKEGYNNVVKGVKEVCENDAIRKQCLSDMDRIANNYSNTSYKLTKDDISYDFEDMLMDKIWSNIESTPSGKKARRYADELDQLFNDIDKYSDVHHPKTPSKQSLNVLNRDYILKQLNPLTSYRARHDVFEVALYEESDVMDYIEKVAEQLTDDYIQK